MSQQTSGHSVTYCVGRYLVDLPSDAYLRGGRFDHAYVEIEVESMPHENYLQEVSSAEKKMEGLTHEGKSPLLVKTLKLADGSRILAYWKHETSLGAIVDGYYWSHGKRYLFRKVVTGSKIDEGTALMTKFISRVRPLESGIPSAPGFCIPDAIILDDGRTYPESTTLYFEFKNKKDITFDLTTKVNEGTPPESLLSRKPSVMSALGILGATLGGLHTIKEGDRTIGDVRGQEWLITAPNDRGHRAHLFTWEAPGVRRDKSRPQIRVDLESAKYGQGVDPGPASLSDQEMLKLWESILGTLRLRPTDNNGPSAVEPKPSPQTSTTGPLPLGELAVTGTICPQTGYWQCPDRDIHGSPRLFQQGETMPAAVIKRDLSFVERLKGANAEVSTTTVWRLVKYAEVPKTLVPPTLLDDRASQSNEA